MLKCNFWPQPGSFELSSNFLLGFDEVSKFLGIVVQLFNFLIFFFEICSQLLMLCLECLESLSDSFMALDKLRIQLLIVRLWIVAPRWCVAGFLSGPFLLWWRLRLAIAVSFVATAAVAKN